MATYKCKTSKCDGEVTFAEGSNKPESNPKKQETFLIVIVGDEPSECPECRTSWYAHELEA